MTRTEFAHAAAVGFYADGVWFTAGDSSRQEYPAMPDGAAWGTREHYARVWDGEGPYREVPVTPEEYRTLLQRFSPPGPYGGCGR